MSAITVHKISPDGRELSYVGTVISRDAMTVVLEAPFSLSHEHDAGYVVFRPGDRCVEWFYADRWYNILELHDITDDRLKGWYCNVARPAAISDESIRYDDLALDLWIAPDGSTLLLDEDEFAALNLDAETQQEAWKAIDQLREMITKRRIPFDGIA